MKYPKTNKAFKKSGRFCLRNWRDKHCMQLRNVIYEKLNGFDKQFAKFGKFEIRYMWYADQYYVWILDLENNFLYLVTWYKERGKTDMILFQGEPIYLDELKYLLKRLKK